MCALKEKEKHSSLKKKKSWVAYESKPVLYIVKKKKILIVFTVQQIVYWNSSLWFGASCVANISSHVFCASAIFLYVTF